MRVQLADACSGRGRSQGLLNRHEGPGTEGPAISVSADPGIKKPRVSRHSRSACAMCRGPERLPYFNTDEIRRRPASSAWPATDLRAGGDDRESCRNKPQRSSRPDGPQHSPARNARPHMAPKGGFGQLARLDDQLGPYASVVTGDTSSPPGGSSQNDLGHPRSRLRRHPLDHTARRNQCHTRNCSPPRRSSPTRRSC